MKETDIPDSSRPPMQNAPGVVVSDSFGCVPFYRFVSICLSEDSVEVIETLPTWGNSIRPAEENADSDTVETYVENVIQTYAISVPYTEQTGGETLTKFRTEHRTRTVPVTRRRKQSNDAEEKTEEHSYTVCVPYTEMIDGVPVVRSRLETRTRHVSKDQLPSKLHPLQQSQSYARNELSFYDVGGQQLDVDDVLESLDGHVPVIQIADPDHLVPYFSAILKPETRFLVVNVSPEPGDNA